MSKIETLVAIANKLPDQRIDELVDFAGFLYHKEDSDGEIDGMLLSYDVAGGRLA
ncbi:MAG TPA: hypothetical protein VFH95_03460 [Candidatus Kapabacteria bacterium]|nr:hypothetical protein [Candidatus Kapabacteria bacterium]